MKPVDEETEMDAYELGIVTGLVGLVVAVLTAAAYRLIAWLFPA